MRKILEFFIDNLFALGVLVCTVLVAILTFAMRSPNNIIRATFKNKRFQVRSSCIDCCRESGRSGSNDDDLTIHITVC